MGIYTAKVLIIIQIYKHLIVHLTAPENIESGKDVMPLFGD